MNIRRAIIYLSALLLVAITDSRSSCSVATRDGEMGVADGLRVPTETTAGLTTPISANFEAYGTFIIAPVRINGSSRFSFIVDTGAKYTQVNARLSKALGLEKNSKATLDVAGAILEGVEIHTPSFEEFEGALGRHIDGIIGYDLFRRFAVEIDYQNCTLTLYEAQHYRYRGKERPIRIKVRDGFPLTVGTLGLRDGKFISADLEIDTGSTGALELYGGFVEATHLLQNAGPTISNSAWNAAGLHEERVGRIRSVQVGAYTMHEPVVNFRATATPNFGPPGCAGLIGAEILQRFKVILDYSHKSMILEPNEKFAMPFEWDMSGIYFDATGIDFSTYRVSGVLQQSPASEAGLREDDIVLAIDGVPAASLGSVKIERMFMQPGRKFRVQIQRNKQTMEVDLKTRRLV